VVATVGKPGQPGEHVRCVVSVSMLTEGWDANNVTHILGIRAFGSQLLCEQVVGRGLRRMDYVPDPKTGLLTEEYVDVYGIPFTVIPFKGRPLKAPAPDDRPKNHVRALPERKAMEMRFPVVEGYAFALRKNLIRCDVDGMPPLEIEPNREPTATFVRPTVGYAEGSPAAQSSPFPFVSRTARNTTAKLTCKPSSSRLRGSSSIS
jgi:type III restriction enzyme